MGNIEEFIAGYWNTVPLLISFAGGIIAFLSPCTLPLLPVYISYISGVGIKEEIDGKKRLKMVLSTLAFVIGFTIIFVLMAIVVSYFGNIARKLFYNDIIYKIVGILVIIMGIQMTGIFKFRFLNREKKIELNFIFPSACTIFS